ncbi:MAG: DUF2975 domain-containing protein [Eubacterium sp.]|nr:DUF2975 domain-containing protein [Eubacterium sp.]
MMKYTDKTTGLTHFIVRLCYVLLAASVIAFPILMRASEEDFYYFVMLAGHGRYLIVPYYLVVPAGYVALICLDKILSNIKKDLVFDSRNIRLLNIITGCCLFAAAVGLVSYVVIALIYQSIETVFLLAAGEAFMALVVRVVRNVLKKAIVIKEENDLVV